MRPGPSTSDPPSRGFARSTFLLVLVAALVAFLVPGLSMAQPAPGCDPEDVDSFACPDLLIIDAAHAIEGDRVVITALVANLERSASPASLIEAAAPGWEPATAEVRALKGGDRETVVLGMDIPDSQRGETVSFTLTADAAGEVDEVEEGNNERIIEDVTIPAANLVLAVDSEEFTEDELVITVTVSNLGDASSRQTTVVAEAPGWTTGAEEIPELQPEGSQQVALSLLVPEEQRGSTVSVTIRVDPEDVEPESNEEDNVAVLEVAVPAPDLTAALQSSALADDQLTITVTVSNGGEAPSGPTRVAGEAAGWEPVTADVPPLAPESSEQVTLDLSVPEDQRGATATLTVTVDPEDEVTESDEGNNVATLSMTIPQGPGEEVRVEPVSGRPGVLPVTAAAAVVLAGGLLLWRLLRRPRTGRRPRRPVPRSLAPAVRPVATGFTPEGDPFGAIGPNVPLAPGARYLFWVEVGEARLEGPERPPADLTAAVFSLGEGFGLEAGGDMGELRLEPDGRAAAMGQPAGPLHGDSRRLPEGRLLFPVRAPEGTGTAQLRCNLYHGRLLVQSRLIRAQVGGSRRRNAVTDVVDYTLAPSLDPGHLTRLPEHRLSIMLNRNADGTHGFSFLGEGGFKSSASFDTHELQDVIRQARGALRRAAWGDEQEWDPGKGYRYGNMGPDRLRGDLTLLAIRGFRFYAQLLDRLAGGTDPGRFLTDLMRTPGLVQVAMKESPRHVVPAALLYDYVGFDSTARPQDYDLCPAFLDGLSGDIPLDEHRCFRGECPSRGAELTICPSGFWGYRHALGMPLTVGEGPDVPAEILYGTDPALTVAVSTDPEFTLREEHEENLRKLCPGCEWNYAATREDTLRLLEEGRGHVVYLYCHGGVANGVPFLQVGPVDTRGITGDLLFSQGIRWDDPRALVFINGCRTMALEPETALEFMSTLVKWVRASGVIGTEITVFEPLARAFAEEFLRGFLQGERVGESVRRARLALLKAGNPLGLAYIPFALAGLRMTRRR